MALPEVAGRRTYEQLWDSAVSAAPPAPGAIAAAGGTTLAQDEASSVVFGMNREAILAGGIQRMLPLDAIAGELTRLAGVAPSPVIKRAGGAGA